MIQLPTKIKVLGVGHRLGQTTKNFESLRTILAKLYPDKTSIRRIIDDSGIDQSRIDFDPKAVNIWHSVLKEAKNSDKVDALLDVVNGEYGTNERFRNIYDSYRRSKDRIDPGRNIDQGPELFVREGIDASKIVLVQPLGTEIDPINRLTDEAREILKFVITNQNLAELHASVDRTELQIAFPGLSSESINKAVDMLKREKMLYVDRELFSSSFQVTLAPMVWVRYGKKFLGFDPQLDVAQILEFKNSSSTDCRRSGPSIVESLSLPCNRINMAVKYLAEQGLINLSKEQPCPAGFDFSSID